MTGNQTTTSSSATTVARVRSSPSWLGGLGQAITLAIGIFFVVVGAVALIRAGIPSDLVLTRDHVEVGWLHHTALLAILHLFVGAGLLSAGAYAWLDDRPSVFGLFFAIVGLILWIEPGALHDSLAFHRAHGVTYVAVGLGLLLAGWLTSRGRTVVLR